MVQKQIEQYIDAHREEIIATWRDLVNLEGQTLETEHLNKVADFLYKKFSEAGVKCELHSPAGEEAPKVLTGIIGKEREGKPVCFSGHYDTVFKKGTYGENPFRIEGEKAFGPGVLDMKGGIVISLFVIKALESIGYNERPIKIVFCGDEEGGPLHGAAGELMYEYGKGCVCAFNMETGPVGNLLCVGRKAAFGGKFTVHGVSAHSGNNYEVGRNAILEAAHKVIAIQNMNDMEKGTHMNPAIIHGGTMSNSIPDRCDVTFSGRFVTYKELERVEKELADLFSKSTVDGTRCEYQASTMMPPYEKTPQNEKLCEFVAKISDENSYGKIGSVYLGGGSDASFVSKDGMPVLCSCGVRGEWNHTDREYAVVESMFERSKLWGAVVCQIEDFVKTL